MLNRMIAAVVLAGALLSTDGMAQVCKDGQCFKAKSTVFNRSGILFKRSVARSSVVVRQAEPQPLPASPGCSGCCKCGATAVASPGSGPADLQAIALASATYRARRGIKGHCHIDSRHKSGVGWASHNSTPRTCFWHLRSQGGYAVVRGRDGYYASLILR
jgi:hypothetical protein